MTRAEAERIISRILADEIGLDRSNHFRDSAGKRGFTMQDVFAVLGSHVMESAPEPEADHTCHRVRLLGRCLEGRPTRVVLALRPLGPCTLITIMVVRRGAAKTRRKR